MARSSLRLVLDQRTPLTLADKSPKAGRQLLRKVIRHLEGVLGGVVDASHLLIEVDGAQPIAASGTITIASGASVSDTVTINGAAFTAVAGAPAGDQWDQSGTATAECTSLAAQINASSTANVVNCVEASNLSQTITLATCTAGTGVRIAGHDFMAVNGTNASAVASPGDFDMSSTDTNDATSLKNAINAHPVLCHQVVASSSAGVVTVRQRRGTSSLGAVEVIAKAGVTPSGLSVGGATFAASNVVLLSAINEGLPGNCFTLAESTAGARIAVSAARLAGGTGADSGSRVRVVIGGRLG